METENNVSHSIASKNIFYTQHDDWIHFFYYSDYFSTPRPTSSNTSVIIHHFLFRFIWICIFLGCLCLESWKILC